MIENYKIYSGKFGKIRIKTYDKKTGETNVLNFTAQIINVTEYHINFKDIYDLLNSQKIKNIENINEISEEEFNKIKLKFSKIKSNNLGGNEK